MDFCFFLLHIVVVAGYFLVLVNWALGSLIVSNWDCVSWFQSENRSLDLCCESVSLIMPSRRACGRRPEAESDMGHEPNPRDIEIQNLRRQVERLTQRLEHMEHPNHREDYNDDTDAEEFIKLFHSRSLVRR